MNKSTFNLGIAQLWIPPKILLIMRLIIIMLTLSIMHASAVTGYAQKLTISKSNASIADVFLEINKQTGYNFLYTNLTIKDAKPINLNVKDRELIEVLDLCFSDQPFSYEIKGRSIVVKEKDPTFLERVVAALTYTDVSCHVVDADGKGLPGASVAVKGKNKTVSTDQNGEFFIRGVEEKDILVVSYVGYQPLEISVKEAVSLGKIVLKEIVGELDEVRLIGYGTTTQRLSTGNTSRITAEDIEKQPVANPLQTLQGRMPGVLVTNGQGLPGTETKIQIRGINSISGHRDPLYIVDGVPFSASILKGSESPLRGFINVASDGGFTPFNSLSPSDIESIDVLKDADATAIYGARGANGVVLITTRKGNDENTKVNFNINRGIQRASHLVKDFLTTDQYIALEKEGAINDGYNVNDIKEYLPEIFLWDQNDYTNWQKEILGNTGYVTNITGAISGGSQRTKFLLGGNYHKEGTIYPGDLSYVRGGVHLNVNHDSQNRKFFTSSMVSYSSDKNLMIRGSLPIFNIPNFPLYKPNGQLNFDNGVNYLAILQQKSITKADNVIGSGQIGYRIRSNFIFKTGLSFNRLSFNGFGILPLSSQDPAYNPTNSAQYANNASTTINLEPQLDYNVTISNGKLQALIGGSYQSTVSQGNFIQGENYKDENLFESLGAAGKISYTYDQHPITTSVQYKYASLFGRLNYNIKEKYIVNINYRRDGSSKFGLGNQFGNFGSVGTAWIFSNERFIKQSIPFLSYGKLRASYGTVGNEPVLNYQYLQSYGSSSAYQGNTGLIPNRLANADYRWEVVKKTEISLEAGFFKDRVLLSTSWFKNRSNNQLLSYSLPGITGFTGYTANLPAMVDNKGLEFSLNTRNIRNDHFIWNTNFNLSFIDNKLVSYPNLERSSLNNKYEIGQSLSIKKGPSFAGVDPQTGNALFYTQSNEKTSEPGYPNDYFNMGKTMPDYYGGMNNSFIYKGIQLDFLVQFVKQNNYLPYFVPGYSGGYMPELALDRWQKQGDITNIPKSSLVNPNFNYANSNFFFGDASYIKLKNVSLSYIIPTSWLTKKKIDQCKVYILGQNLLTITKYKGSDPEVPSGGLIVPTLRTIIAGIQMTL